MSTSAAARRPALLFLCLLLPVSAARAAGDSCACGDDDDFAWSAVGQTSGMGGWSCSGGDGVPGADDDFRIGDDCTVHVIGDILQDGGSSTAGLRVDPGGTLVAEVGAGDRLRLSLDGGGLDCRGECRFTGVFRDLDTSPGNAADPRPWPAGALDPCGGDCDTTPERYCLEYPAAAAPAGLGASLDRVVPGSDLGTGTQDWLCFWDFDKSDSFAAFDDNACYPVTSVRGAAEGPPYQLCVDARQGRDNNYPHRLRVIDDGLLAEPLAAGEGCGYVLHPASGRRSTSCGGAFVRVRAAQSGIQADDEYVGRFLRFADGAGLPQTDSYKILQTLDCAAAIQAPHPCAGSTDDIIVLGSLAGVTLPQAAGDTYWIDYGWKPADGFFILAPVQIDSATPAGDDTNIALRGEIDLYGVHFTDLGGRGDAVVAVEPGGAAEPPEVARWRHVIVRNDTADYVPNAGQDLRIDSLSDAVIGHTNVLSGSGHGVVFAATLEPSQDLTFEDTSIRHHHDGCFNHSEDPVVPGITVRRAWCAFIQHDALSAQFFAWQSAMPSATVIEDSGCDACDAEHYAGTLRSNHPTQGDGWMVRRSLFWAPVGGVTSNNDSWLEDSLFVGFRGSAGFASTLLPANVERSVVRDVAIHTDKSLAKLGSYRDSVFRDLLFARSAPAAGANPGARIENVAWLDFDNVHPDCLSGEELCAVISEALPSTDDVRWSRNLFAWTPGRQVGMAGGPRYKAVSAPTPPRYDGIAVAHHAFVGGGGSAFLGLSAATVGQPDWGHGPCFEGNLRDVHPGAAPGMPEGTSWGVPLGFVDPAAGRFDTPAGSHADQAGCGLDPAEPAGNRVYGYIHARTGLAPEVMADDADGDGVPENIPAPICVGPIGSSACLDSCSGLFNPDQADADADGAGDACEPACSNGLDDDGDGHVDWPADPGCRMQGSLAESRRCQNGSDDDGDGGIDFDGAASWNGGVPIAPADDDCLGLAFRDRESLVACGLGFELALLLPALAALRRRRAQSPGA